MVIAQQIIFCEICLELRSVVSTVCPLSFMSININKIEQLEYQVRLMSPQINPGTIKSELWQFVKKQLSELIVPLNKQ